MQYSKGIAGITVFSLAVAAISVFKWPLATFYSPLTRLWELSLGGGLAVGILPSLAAPRARNAITAIGLVLITGSIFLLRASMPFPALLALPPCLGAALVIWGGGAGLSVAGRLLSLRPVRFVGAISYSLYLWHWPITVFQGNYAFLGDGLSHIQSKIAIVIVSFAAAVLSWWAIEQPFREGRWRPSATVLGRMAACAIVLLVAFGLTATAREGFPARFTPAELEVVTHLLTAPDKTWRSGTCFLYDNRSDYRLTPDCLAVDTTKKNYLLLGDSYAAQLSYGLAAEFPQIHFLQATAADCYPTLSHTVTENDRCIGLMDGVLKDFLAHTPVDNLIIAARWRPSVFDSLAQTLAWLRERHVRVTLIGPTYPFDAPMPRLVMRALRTEDPQRVWRHRDESAKEWDASLREMARAQGIDYISLTDLQCKRYPCQSEGSPWPEMFDSEHFNNLGARIIARRIRETDALFGQ